MRQSMTLSLYFGRHFLMAILTVLVTLGVLAMLVNARGGRLIGHVEGNDPMPLTASLAGLVAWTLPGLLVLLLMRVRDKQQADPANRSPMTIYMRNKLSPEAGAAVKATRLTYLMALAGNCAQLLAPAVVSFQPSSVS